MRKKFFLSYICILCMLICGCSDEAISVEKGENIFGTFSTTDVSGNPINEQIFKECKLTMVNIWATFCSPCVEEMPELAQLQVEFGEDFQIVGIVVDVADKNGNVLLDKKAEAASVIETTGADYLHILPSRSLNKAYLNNVQSVPETIFLDENGNQVGTRYFGAKSKEEWQKIIEVLLESIF